jgi:hypothetical protein
MSGTVREVGMPDAAPPQHTMSPEGAARLAALTPEQLQPPQKAADEPKVVKDADGNVANLENGTYEPAPKPDGQAERTTPAPEVDVSIIPELAVSAPYQEAAQLYREDVAAIAAEYPALKSEAAALFEYIGTAAAAELAKASSDGAAQQGQTIGPDLRNPDQCRQVLRMKYGESMANTLMDQAAKEFARLPESVRRWIDADVDGTGNRIGNHPALVEGLALRAFARLSPEAAQRDLDQIRASKGYQAGDKLSVAKARMLQIVISRAQGSQPSAPAPRGKAFGTRGDDVAAGQGSQAAAALRAELKAMSDTKSDLFSSDGAKRKRAVARRQEIVSQLGGNA